MTLSEFRDVLNGLLLSTGEKTVAQLTSEIAGMSNKKNTQSAAIISRSLTSIKLPKSITLI